MANRIAFEMSDSFSSSEASDAGSSASHWTNDVPATAQAPVVRAAAPASSSGLALPPSSANVTTHTAPAIAAASPQPGTTSPTLTGSTGLATPPALVLDAGVLTINESNVDNTQIRSLLLADPGIHGIVITQQTALGDWECSLLAQLDGVPTLNTIKFDLVGNRTDGPRLCGMETAVEGKLASLFMNNPNLTRLDLSGQGISSWFPFQLAKSLDKSKTSGVLDFNGGDFCLTQMEAAYYGQLAPGIACLIATPGCASTILASSRGIGDEGAVEIAAALEKNTDLTTLALAGNPMGDKGYVAIFDAVRKNKGTALLHLDVAASRMGIKAAKSLARLLKNNTSLVEVRVGGVNDVESIRHIRDGLLKNKSVVKLHFVIGDNQNRKFLEIRSQINAELQKRALAAGTGTVTAPANMTNTASSATTTATTKPPSGKEPG